MRKNKLKGKWISYHDMGQREAKVVKVVGRTLTIVNAIGEKMDINPDEYKIRGVYVNKKLEDIEWK